MPESYHDIESCITEAISSLSNSNKSNLSAAANEFEVLYRRPQRFVLLGIIRMMARTRCFMQDSGDLKI